MRMIRDQRQRAQCEVFLRETTERDGYALKETASKQQSMDWLCLCYKKMAYALEQGMHGAVLLNGYTLALFQESQKKGNDISAGSANASTAKIKKLMDMGFAKAVAERAL